MESSVSNVSSPAPGALVQETSSDASSAAFAAHSHPNDDYRKVKMKYFMSLGMNKPAKSASDIVEPGTKERTRTMPGANVMPSSQRGGADEEWETGSVRASVDSSAPLDIASARQRSLSTPPIAIQRMVVSPTHQIPIPMNIPSAHGRHWKTESPDSGNSSVGSTSSVDKESDDDFESFHKSHAKKEFIPPHILAQQRDASAPFQVGTARSVTVWEQNRRKQHSNV